MVILRQTFRNISYNNSLIKDELAGFVFLAVVK